MVQKPPTLGRPLYYENANLLVNSKIYPLSKRINSQEKNYDSKENPLKSKELHFRKKLEEISSSLNLDLQNIKGISVDELNIQGSGCSTFLNTAKNFPKKFEIPIQSILFSPIRENLNPINYKQNSTRSVAKRSISSAISNNREINYQKKAVVNDMALINKLKKEEKDERYLFLLNNSIIDHIETDSQTIFALLPQLSNIIIVYRRPVVRNRNLTFLTLASKNLTQIPLLEGEEKLTTLSLRSNQIKNIDHLVSLPLLKDLDLSHNSIHKIANLNLRSLQVLNISSNYVEGIEGLEELKNIEILDLHDNMIKFITNLQSQVKLKILNLSQNIIQYLPKINYLKCLEELNLKNNKISVIYEPITNSELKKLYLSNNLIDDLSKILTIPNLLELDISFNPVTNIKDFDKQLSEKFVFVKGIYKGVNVHNPILSLEVKPLDNIYDLINEPTYKMKGDMAKVDIPKEDILKAFMINGSREIAKSLIAELKSSNYSQLLMVTENWKKELKLLEKGETRKEDITSKIEKFGFYDILDNKSLSIYGNCFEILNHPKINLKLEEIKFYFVNFEIIVSNSLLKALENFQSLKSIVLCKNNLWSFISLSKLEFIPKLSELVIIANPISSCKFLKLFLAYRFQTLKSFNREEINEKDKTNARYLFGKFDEILLNKLSRKKQSLKYHTNFNVLKERASLSKNIKNVF